jgi:hypothetical protein
MTIARNHLVFRLGTEFDEVASRSYFWTCAPSV